MEYVDILDVKISRVNYKSAMDIIGRFLADERKHQVVTPNPEFVVLAQADSEFCQILNQADLAISDGVGLRMAAKFLSLPAYPFILIRLFQLLLQGLFVGAAAIFKPSFLDVLPETVTGTDLMVGLCDLAAKKGYSVFLLGGRGGVAEEAAKRLKVRFANLNIIGTYEGDAQAGSFALRPTPSSTRGGVNSSLEAGSSPPLSVPANADSSDSQNQSPFAFTIVSSGVGLQAIDFLFVAYGAPKQEKWIACNLPKIPVKVAMGVGGAFDFIAGKRKRAPGILHCLGLEWFWRLLQEPQRLPRILNATIKFPLLVFFHKLSQNRR